MISEGPLEGCRVLVTRPQIQAAVLVELLQERGAAVTVIPLIATEVVADEQDMAMAFRGATDVLLTSSNAIPYCAAAMRRASPVRVWAVGPQTARALGEAGFAVEPTPEEVSGLGLAAHILAYGTEGRRFVLAQAEAANSDLCDRLVEAGADVKTLNLYRTVPVAGAADEFVAALDMGMDAVTFFSGSAAEAAFNAAGSTRLGALLVVCIGETTASVARRVGLQIATVAAVPNNHGVVEALVRTWAERPLPPAR